MNKKEYCNILRIEHNKCWTQLNEKINKTLFNKIWDSGCIAGIKASTKLCITHDRH